MTVKKDLPVAAGLAVLLALATGISETRAQAVPPPPVTINPIQSGIFQRLGITQSFQKVRDANVNRNGNNPQREAKPPLKSIADPANLQSPDPAVKAAALIKQDQDLAPQKIKAIKYLATQCCCCDKYKGTAADPKMALLAALDDCTEQVRYAAAQAFCQCAGNVCSTCNKCGCCDPKIMNKLNKMANFQDDKGCWSEPSPRVRAMAAGALEACRQVTEPTVVTPTPAPPKETEPLKRIPGTKEVPAAPKPYTEPAPPAKPPKQAPQPVKTISSVTIISDESPAPATVRAEPSVPATLPAESVAPVTKAVCMVPADPTDPSPPSVSRWLKAAPLLDSRWQAPGAAETDAR